MKKIFLIFLLLSSVSYANEDNASWKKYYFSDSDIKAFKQNGVRTPEEAKKWMAFSGIRIQDLKKFKEANIKPTKVVKFIFDYYGFIGKEKINHIQKECKKINTWYFNASDIYNNKGNCYVYDAELFQRFDRTTGLAQGNNGSRRVFFVKFNNSWNEGRHRKGIIKGLGKFSYETTDGRVKNVSKGVILY